jgi:dimethylhistidine N-methyltransferase
LQKMQNNLHELNKIDPQEKDLLAEVIEGLGQPQKRLPSKLFYDRRGSELFDQICNLDEYYLTRTEMRIMNQYIDEIAELIGKKCLLIELGSGSSTKVRLLLDHLIDPVGYVPIDISSEHLIKASDLLAADYPSIKIIPVYADYTQPFDFPDTTSGYSKKVVYYPGSTIGNFTPRYAARFISRIAKRSGRGSGLLIGIDLKKDKDTLEAAYNDRYGVTAAFNLNILERLNRELGADFDTSQWKHHAFYNDDEGRIEMHLVSLEHQRVNVNGTPIKLKKDETILTEYSYKYTNEEFENLVSNSFELVKVWTDQDEKFSIQYLMAR